MTLSSTVTQILNDPKKKDKLRNISIIAHVDHGKSTLSDNLLSQAGFLSKDAVGATLTDSDQQEKSRGITINNAAVTISYKDHILNLIDTPGHADFGVEVSKSLRSVDGAILVMDSLEGVMVQTQSVISQAIKENVKLILFVNKVDRTISELKLTPYEVFKKLEKNIYDVNQLIKKLTAQEENYFSFETNVIFGSALNKWALTIPLLKKNNKKFSDYVEMIQRKEAFPNQFSLAKVVFDKMIETIDYPLKSHASRIEKMYQGDSEGHSKLEESFLNNPLDEPFRAIVTDINYDKNMGLLHTIRIVSGVYDKNKKLYSSQDEYLKPIKAPNKLAISMLKKLEQIETAYAGMIITLQGLDIKSTGITLSQKEKDYIIFPAISYMREPIFSLSVSPKNLADTQKMVKGLEILSIQDPTLKLTYDETSKEFILAGVGVLHLEVTLKKLELDHNVQIVTGAPRIPYVQTLPFAEDEIVKSETVKTRTSNKHNDFEFYLFNLPSELVRKLLKNEVSAKNLNHELAKYLPRELAKAGVKQVDQGNVYFDMTHGAQFMEECKTLLAKSIEMAFSKGVKLDNPLKGIGLVFTDAVIHEDNLHRQPIQIRGAIRQGLQLILKSKNPSIIKEPVMELQIRCPSSFIEDTSVLVTNKRGYLEETHSEDATYVRLHYKIPLSETLDITSKLMSTTEGRATFSMEFYKFEELPENMMKKVLEEGKTKK